MGTRGNRDGIGATITISAAGSTQRRTVTAGSQMSQNMLVARFGLGTAEHVDTLTVRRPSGRSSNLSNVAANQMLIVTEPDG